MGSKKTELREECRRLRLDERLSYNQIHQLTGASKGTLSIWLCDIPLTAEERQKKRARRKGPIKSRGDESSLHKMFSGIELTRSQKAKVSETAVLLRLCLCKFKVYGSPFDGDSTDWLVENESGILLKLEVRWAGKWTPGLPIVSLRKSDGHTGLVRYGKDDFDVLAAYDLFSDTVFVYTASELENRKCNFSVNFTHAEEWDKVRNFKRE